MSQSQKIFKTNKNALSKIAVYFMVALFAGVGIMHFVKTETFALAMPNYLPEKILLVQLTGVIEILGAVGLLISKTRRAAGICIALFLVCVFPVNLNMALHPEDFHAVPAWALYLRLPIQGVLIWLAMVASTYTGSCQKPENKD